MIEIFYFTFAALISFALGQRVLKLIGTGFESESENFIFSFPLGLVILAYITFFFGIIGLLYKSMLIAVLSLLFILLIKDIKSATLNLFKFIKNLNKNFLVKEYKIGFNYFSILLIFLLLFISLNLIASFAPPWNFDVLTYHLAVEKIYIRAHKIIFVPYIFFSNFPSLVDTIYLNGLLLHNGILSNLFGYALGITLVLAIYCFCKKFFSSKTAILASLIFYSFPMVIGLSSTAHIDVQLTLFVFLSFYGLFMYFRSKNNKWLILCSIFAGFGASSQSFGAVAAFGILVLLIFHLFQESFKKNIGYRTAFFKIIIFCLIVLIIILPWLLKSYLYTGNPFWPVFNDIFNGKYWDKKHQEGLSYLINSKEINLVNYIRLPWDIHTPIDRQNVYEELGIGPFFLAFLPLYFLLRKKDKILNKFFILIFIYITIWFFISVTLRYIIFIMPLVAIISAYLITNLLKNIHLSKVLKILLILTFSFNLLLWFGGKVKEMPVAIGLESADNFYLKYPGSIYKASKFINNELPQDSKILLFRDNRGFFLDRDYIWADPILQAYIDYSKFKNENDFYKELKRLGVTHILVNTEFEWRGVIVNEYRYSKRILDMTNKLLDKYTINLYSDDGILINKLK